MIDQKQKHLIAGILTRSQNKSLSTTGLRQGAVQSKPSSSYDKSTRFMQLFQILLMRSGKTSKIADTQLLDLVIFGFVCSPLACILQVL